MRNLIAALAATLALAAAATPAKRGVTHTLRQPDGTTVQLIRVGDEHHSYYLTADGKAVMNTGGGFRYASTDASGRLEVSDVLAHDPGERTPGETAFAAAIDDGLVLEAMAERSRGIMRANEHDAIGRSNSKFPTKGEVKSVILLVEFADKPFVTPNAGDYFRRQINEPGFSDDGGTGSARDYFIDASMGQFRPQFDVYGPVTLPNDMIYYGEEGFWGTDKNPQHMMLHAARILDEMVDFSQYDTNADGFVDNVYIIYAGRGQADADDPNTVWPHSSAVGRNAQYKFDGVYLSQYACGNEMQSDTRPDGIGTFCHEFSHVLGLPDLYNTVDAYNDYTPGLWSILDQGCYNNDSCTPPTYSAFERNALGWMGDNLEELTEPADCVLEDLPVSNKAYLIPTENKKEYFILENRQQTGWDKYIPYHGMLVWHIDYVNSRWSQNTVNNSPSHQYVDLVEACGKNYSAPLQQRKYPFPGTGKVTSFIYGGTPSLESWYGVDPGMDITEIKETDGVITFKAAGGAAGIEDVLSDGTVAVSGRRLTATAAGVVTVTDLQGRGVACGAGSVDAVLAPGVYIVRADGATTKLLVK